MTTKLDPHRRGDSFEYTFTLGNDWVGADFTGGVKWTLRAEVPPSTVVTDDDAIDQASVAGGEITFVDEVGTIAIPASRTNAWPAGRLFWDLEAKISGSPIKVYTLASGTLPILGDLTRAP